MDEQRPPEERGVSDALRVAIERTLSSVGDTGVVSAADLPAQTVARAGELLDEVARRGYDAGADIARVGKGATSELARRGQDARDVSFAITSRVLEAVAETLRRESKPKVEGK